jgi:hypothetical protein
MHVDESGRLHDSVLHLHLLKNKVNPEEASHPEKAVDDVFSRQHDAK